MDGLQLAGEQRLGLCGPGDGGRWMVTLHNEVPPPPFFVPLPIRVACLCLALIRPLESYQVSCSAAASLLSEWMGRRVVLMPGLYLWAHPRMGCTPTQSWVYALCFIESVGLFMFFLLGSFSIFIPIVVNKRITWTVPMCACLCVIKDWSRHAHQVSECMPYLCDSECACESEIYGVRFCEATVCVSYPWLLTLSPAFPLYMFGACLTF